MGANIGRVLDWKNMMRCGTIENTNTAYWNLADTVRPGVAARAKWPGNAPMTPDALLQ